MACQKLTLVQDYIKLVSEAINTTCVSAGQYFKTKRLTTVHISHWVTRTMMFHNPVATPQGGESVKIISRFYLAKVRLPFLQEC